MSASAIEAGRAYVTVAVKGTKESVDGLTKMTEGMKDRLASGGLRSALIGGFAGGIAGVVGNVLSQVAAAWPKIIGAITGMIRSNLETIWEYSEGISNVVKMADRLGTTVGFVSKMRTVMEDSGATMADFESAMKAFQRNMFTAGTGVGEAKGAFEQLKLDPKDLSLDSLENAVFRVVDATKQLGSTSEVSGVMMRIMGENASKMIPFLQGNTGLFESLTKQSQFLGRTLNEDGARGVDKMRDSWVKLGRQLDSIWEQFVIKVAPAISSVIDGGLIPLIKTLSDVIMSFGDAETTGQFFGRQMKIIAEILLMQAWTAGKVANSVLGMFSTLLRTTYGMIKLHNAIRGMVDPFGVPQMFKNIEKNLGGMANEFGRANAALDRGLNNFWPQFRKNQEEWQKMIDEEQAATKTINDGLSEDVTFAANKIAAVFGGEALQRNASTMQKMQEMTLKNSTDIRDYVKKIHQSLITAPVVKGTL